MRITLDIDDGVLAAVEELSRQQGYTEGQTVSALLRRALVGDVQLLAGPAEVAAATVGGFRPFASRASQVTNDLVDCLRDAGAV